MSIFLFIYLFICCLQLNYPNFSKLINVNNNTENQTNP